MPTTQITTPSVVAATIETVKEAPHSLAEPIKPGSNVDPTLAYLGWLLAVVVIFTQIIKPLWDSYNKGKADKELAKVNSAKATAEEELYKHLAEQVREYRAQATKSSQENSVLQEEVFNLRRLAEDLKDAQDSIANMKNRLDEKDTCFQNILETFSEERRLFLETLSIKDAELRRRDDAIYQMMEKIKALELRVQQDEVQFTQFSCPYAKSRRASDHPAETSGEASTEVTLVGVSPEGDVLAPPS